jgi:hypothetical protein
LYPLQPGDTTKAIKIKRNNVNHYAFRGINKIDRQLQELGNQTLSISGAGSTAARERLRGVCFHACHRSASPAKA